MHNSKLIQLDKSKKSSADLTKYYKMLDSSFEPALSTYVNLEEYADKLINNAYVAVCFEENKFVGTFSIYINDPKKETAYISSLAIMDEFKGTGYAKYLMTEAVNVAKTAKMQKVLFEVKSSYERAIGFHEKFGFLRSDEKTKDESTFYMYMPLIENNEPK